MGKIKRWMAVALLAVFATLGAQTAKADGVLLSDNHRDGVLLSDHSKDGVLLSDKQSSIKWDIASVVLRMVNGVLLSD